MARRWRWHSEEAVEVIAGRVDCADVRRSTRGSAEPACWHRTGGSKPESDDDPLDLARRDRGHVASPRRPHAGDLLRGDAPRATPKTEFGVSTEMTPSKASRAPRARTGCRTCRATPRSRDRHTRCCRPAAFATRSLRRSRTASQNVPGGVGVTASIRGSGGSDGVALV